MTSRPKRDDGGLVRACLRGDESAWETLILRYRRLIYSIPVAYRLPADQADDIFQRVAVKLFEHLGKLRRVESLASWLIATTRRECQAQKRSSSRWDALDEGTEAALSESPPDVAQALHDIQCEHSLALAFEDLDDMCRELLLALYREEPTPSYHEIASRMDRPIGSLGPTRNRCLKKLRGLYDRLGGEKP